MLLLDLSPEEALAASAAIALTIFKYYSIENATLLTDFFNSIQGDLSILISRQELIDLNKANCERAKLSDTDNIEERLQILEDLLLSLK